MITISPICNLKPGVFVNEYSQPSYKGLCTSLQTFSNSCDEPLAFNVTLNVTFAALLFQTVKWCALFLNI